MKLRTEINNLATQGGLSDADYAASVLSSVTAHLAETTTEEESYYTYLAKFEFINMSRILEKSTTVSSFMGDDVDPLKDVRQKNSSLKKQLHDELANCVAGIKSKINAKAKSLEQKALEQEKIVTTQTSGANLSQEEKLTEEEIRFNHDHIKALRENAKGLREKANSYEPYEKELKRYLSKESTTLSDEASKLLGQLRRYISANKTHPQSFADWNMLVVKALSSPKLNADVMAVITLLLTEVSQHQEIPEKMMRNAMLERTTASNALQMISHVSNQATKLNAEKQAAEELASQEQKEKLKAQKEVEEQKKINEKLNEELETGSRRTLGNGFAPAQSDRQHGSQDPFNDFISMIEFWDLDIAFVVVILMSEWRRQKDYAEKNMLEATKNHYPNAEATFQKLEVMIINLATMKVQPHQAIAEVLSLKISVYDREEKKLKRRQLQAVSYLGRLALVLEKHGISLANKKVGQYIKPSHSKTFELMQRFIELFADNGPYSLLPRSAPLVTSYQKESKTLIESIATAHAQENGATNGALAIVSSQASYKQGASKNDSSFETQKKELKKSVEDRKYNAAKSGAALLTKQTEDVFKTNANGTKASLSTTASDSGKAIKPILPSYKEKTTIKRRNSFSGFATSSLTLSQ